MIPRLPVVFTRQLEILVTALVVSRNCRMFSQAKTLFDTLASGNIKRCYFNLTKDLHYLLLYLDSLTSSLISLKPWDDSSGVIRPTVEVEEFSQAFPEAAHPYTSYVNNLYVYPLLLNYSNQKVFSKVSNLLAIERAFLVAAFWASSLILLQLQICEANRE